MVEARLVVTALALMLAMFLAGVHGLRHRIGIAILALLSVTWLTVDKLFEGETLFAIDRRYGLTTADFVGLLGLAVSVLLWRSARSERRGPAAPQPAPNSGGDSHRLPPRPARVAGEDVGGEVGESRTEVGAGRGAGA